MYQIHLHNHVVKNSVEVLFYLIQTLTIFCYILYPLCHIFEANPVLHLIETFSYKTYYIVHKSHFNELILSTVE